MSEAPVPVLPTPPAALQFGLSFAQFLGNPLGFFGADEALQRCFALGDGIFQAVDFRLEFVDAIFHLLALDGIQALALRSPRTFGGCPLTLPFVGCEFAGEVTAFCSAAAPPSFRQR